MPDYNLHESKRIAPFIIKQYLFALAALFLYRASVIIMISGGKMWKTEI
jgi:hypothetical protein